jgi:hypothetical protein
METILKGFLDIPDPALLIGQFSLMKTTHQYRKLRGGLRIEAGKLCITLYKTDIYKQ